jgi:hypothetical protein
MVEQPARPPAAKFMPMAAVPVIMAVAGFPVSERPTGKTPAVFMI